jgi:integrase
MGVEDERDAILDEAEYQQFSDAMMDKPMSYYAFQMLYWCGIRVGELLALTPAAFDFERGILSITKLITAQREGYHNYAKDQEK